MDPWLVGGIVGGIAGGIGGGLAVLLLGLLLPRRKCPNCGELFPRVRKPANRRQMLWGGGTCAKCGCEVDSRGRRIENPKQPE